MPAPTTPPTIFGRKRNTSPVTKQPMPISSPTSGSRHTRSNPENPVRKPPAQQAQPTKIQQSSTIRESRVRLWERSWSLRTMRIIQGMPTRGAASHTHRHHSWRSQSHSRKDANTKAAVNQPHNKNSAFPVGTSSISTFPLVRAITSKASKFSIHKFRQFPPNILGL